MIDGFSQAEVNHGTIPRWMLSFADLLSCLLAFFVLMFSMAIPATDKDIASNDMTKQYPNPYAVTRAVGNTTITVARTDLGLSTDYLYNIIQDQTVTYPGLAKTKLRASEDNLIISIPIKDFDEDLADGMTHIIKNLNNRVAVYSSDLDTGYKVVRILQKKGLEKDISFFESAITRSRIDIVIYP